MLPADFCNCTYDVRATKPELSFPRRDDGHDHLPFLTHHARPSRASLALTREAVTRGEPRIRPSIVTPMPVPPACADLPDRDISTAAPHAFIFVLRLAPQEPTACTAGE